MIPKRWIIYDIMYNLLYGKFIYPHKLYGKKIALPTHFISKINQVKYRKKLDPFNKNSLSD